MFIVGDGYYGKCDRVPGLFHVKTRFLHIYWMPVVPRESYLVFESSGGQQGIAIPLSFRSVLLAWSRMAATLLAVALTLLWVPMFLVLFGSMRPGANPTIRPIDAIFLLICVTFVVALVARFTFRSWNAKPSRAYYLGKIAGFSPSVIAQYLGDELPI